MSILDLSKIHMYDFHYWRVDVNHEEVTKCTLLKFYTSDYPADNLFNIALVNKKILGLMKDETKGGIMTYYVGLKSKMYTYKIQTGKVVKKSKEVRYNVVKYKIFEWCWPIHDDNPYYLTEFK